MNSINMSKIIILGSTQSNNIIVPPFQGEEIELATTNTLSGSENKEIILPQEEWGNEYEPGEEISILNPKKKVLILPSNSQQETPLSGDGRYVRYDGDQFLTIGQQLRARLNIDAEQQFSKNTAFNKNFGEVAGTVIEGDDYRVNDAYDDSVVNVGVTGDEIKTITLTLRDGGEIITTFNDLNENDHVDSLNFNEDDGNLTLGMSGSLIDISENLDGRYLKIDDLNETLDSVTNRGNETTNNITTGFHTISYPFSGLMALRTTAGGATSNIKFEHQNFEAETFYDSLKIYSVPQSRVVGNESSKFQVEVKDEGGTRKLEYDSKGKLSVNSLNLSDTDNIPYDEGVMFYKEGEFQTWSDINNVSLNPSTEIVVRTINKSGVIISKGTVVSPDSSLSGLPVLGLTDSNVYEKSRLLGVLKHSVPDNGEAYVVLRGVVEGFDTSNLSLGFVYADPDNPGELTSTKPSGGVFVIRVGVVTIVDAVNGKIIVDSSSKEVTEDINLNTGYSDVNNISIGLDFNTRTLSLTPTTGVDYYFYQSGIKYIKTSNDIVWSDVEGIHSIYFNSGDLQEIVNPSLSQLRDIKGKYPGVVNLYWSVSQNEVIFINDERHTFDMNGKTKTAFLDYHGCTVLDGSISPNGIIIDGTGNLDTHAQFGHNSGLIRNEDLLTVVDAKLSTIGMSIFYKENLSEWKRTSVSGFSVLNTGTGRVAWNQNIAGTWQLTEATNGAYIPYYIVASNTLGEKTATIPGINEYTSIADAENNAVNDYRNVIANLPIKEIAGIAIVIVHTRDNFSNTVKARLVSLTNGDDYIDLRDQNIAGSGSSTQLLRFEDLLNTPSSLTGSAGKSLFVDSLETDLEIRDINTDDVTEGSNLFYTELRVSSNSDVLANTNYRGVGHIPLSQKGAANGVSTLDSSIRIPNAEMPLTPAFNQITLNNIAVNNSDAVRLDQLNSSILSRNTHQEAVNDMLTTPPSSPVLDSRYIILDGALGLWAGEDDNIAQWNGVSWDFYTPSEGWTVWVKDVDTNYNFNGVDWVEFGTTVTHNNLMSLQGGQSSEYFHLSQSQYSQLHIPVTITGEGYLSLTGQEITANQINLSTNVTDILADSNLSSNVAFNNIDNNFSIIQTAPTFQVSDRIQLAPEGSASGGLKILQTLGSFVVKNSVDEDMMNISTLKDVVFNNNIEGQSISIGNTTVIDDTRNIVNAGSGSFSGTVTAPGGLNTDGKDVYTSNGAFIAIDADGAFGDRTGTNIDHIWHDDTNNAWHFVSDGTYKSVGNSNLYAGSGNFGTEINYGTTFRSPATTGVILDSNGNVHFKDVATSSNYFGIYSDESNSTSGLLFRAYPNAQVQLFYGGSAKLSTTTAGIDVTGSGSFSGSLNYGTTFRSPAATGVILSSYGNIRFKDAAASNNYWGIFSDETTSETLFRAYPNAGVHLFFDGSSKLQTTNAGVEISGTTIVSSTVTASNFILGSDKRIKNVLETAIPDLEGVKIIKFNYKDDLTERDRYGVIAQDLQKVAPEMVYENAHETLSVGYIDFLIAKMAKKDEQISNLENKIEVIEKHIAKTI